MECGDDCFRTRDQLTGSSATLSEGALLLWFAAGSEFVSLDRLLSDLPSAFVEELGADAIEDAVVALVHQGLLETEQSKRVLEQDADVRSSSFGYGEQELDLLRRELAALPRRRVLEVGCGDGRLLEKLLELDPEAICGVDVSEVAIELAQDRLRGTPAVLERGLAEALPVDDQSVDLLVVASSVAWFDADTFWREVRRVVAAGRHAIVLLERSPLLTERAELPPGLSLLAAHVPPPLRVEALPIGVSCRRAEAFPGELRVHDPGQLVSWVRSWAPAAQRSGWPDPAEIAPRIPGWPLRIPCSVSALVVELDALLRSPPAPPTTPHECGSPCPECGCSPGFKPGCPGCYAAFPEHLLPQDVVPPPQFAASPSPAASEGWGDVILSSRLRLARSVHGLPFPHAMSREQSEALLAQVEALVAGDARLSGVRFHRTRALPGTRVAELLEQQRISKELVLGRGAVALISDQTSLLVLEEDHLRIQSLGTGLALSQTLQRACALEAIVAEHLVFAHDPLLGHLTACPSNVGTGLRASCLLHLPALSISGALEPILADCSAAGLAVRGAAGEGTHTRASLWQISNGRSFGWQRDQIVERVRIAVEDLARRELRARAELRRAAPLSAVDRIHRAVATMRSARLISQSEALVCLSLTYLGQELGVLDPVLDEATWRTLLLDVQPGHLCLALQRRVAPEDLDEARSVLLRARLS